ncbi:uncharacterized protein G2W53_012914 [Senna tora]|uniref:Uncharacterized protein n=1 Tax=Senna tora TaxID=362788 RepID=A0A834U179_9FABA|nr:uncharacterized protein G2W53_012914 [Senna tora]
MRALLTQRSEGSERQVDLA